MKPIRIPTESDLRAAPQRASIALLRAAVDATDSAIAATVPGFGKTHGDHSYQVRDELRTVIGVLSARFDELRCLISHYETVVERALNSDDEDDIVF